MSGSRGVPHHRHRLLAGAYPEGRVAGALQRESQEPADGVVVLDDEHSRKTDFDHGWIITGAFACDDLFAHTFH
jgi:hypothetical protein